jgi:hypothetical protein
VVREIVRTKVIYANEAEALSHQDYLKGLSKALWPGQLHERH